MKPVEAKYYTRSEGIVKCHLCPHECNINNGKYGICLVRKNEKGKLITETYGRPVSINADPIEKKPLFHFYPGKRILSIGTLGCNLNCFFCQNAEISQKTGVYFDNQQYISPEQIVGKAMDIPDNAGIAFTYNEPWVYYEYMYDIAECAKKTELKTVMISNGYFSPEPLNHIIPLIDAFNIDLKAFSEEFYTRYAGAHLKPVKDTLLQIHSAGKHLEITCLIIPGLNDELKQFTKMRDWIYNNLGDDQVLHITRYFPAYKSKIPSTPVSTLKTLYESARERLNYVYLGNISEPTGHDTLCPDCGHPAIKRSGYSASYYLDPCGCCIKCGRKIINYW